MFNMFNLDTGEVIERFPYSVDLFDGYVLPYFAPDFGYFVSCMFERSDVPLNVEFALGETQVLYVKDNVFKALLEDYRENYLDDERMQKLDNYWCLIDL